MFKRTLFVWEEEELGRLLDFIPNGRRMKPQDDDALKWKVDLSRVYTVNSMYNWISSTLQPVVPHSKLILEKYYSIQGLVFWMASLERKIKNLEL